MGAAPGRAKTCKIMQIAFVRTSRSLPLTPVLPLLPAAPSPARRLPPIPSSCLSFSLFPELVFRSRLSLSLFLLFSSLFHLSPFRLTSFSALYSTVLQHLSPSSALFSFISLSILRARVRASKMFRRLYAAAFVPLFLPRGWNTRLGGAAAAAAGAHRGMKPRPPYLRLSVARVGSGKKSGKSRDPPFASYSP